MKLKIIKYCIVCFVIMLFCLSCISIIHFNNINSVPVTLSDGDLLKLLPSYLKGSYIVSVHRNFSGSELFINTESNMITISEEKTTVAKSPAYSLLNECGNSIVWYNDLKEGIHFKNYIRILTVAERFGIAASGTFFFISDYNTHITEVFSVKQPDRVLVSIPSCDAYSIFYYDNIIYLFMNNGINQKDFLYIIESNGENYAVSKYLSIPGAVVDMESSKNVILDNRSDLFPLWSVYNIMDGKKVFLSKRKSYGFFVSKDLSKVIARLVH